MAAPPSAFLRLWQSATTPHASIKDAHARSRAQVLSTILLVSAALDLLFALIVIPAVYGRANLLTRPDWLLPASAFPMSVIFWLISRGPRPRIASIGISVFAVVAIWSRIVVMLHQLPDSRELVRTLAPLVLAQLFVGTFLPFRYSLRIGFANLLGLALLPLLAFHIPVAETIGTSILFAAATATILATAWLHRRDLQVIRKEEGDRLAAEEALERSRRLEALGRLAGGIAHDFNNMLTSILARLDSARARKPSQAIARELDGIEAAAERAAALVRRLLDHGRPRQPKTGPIDFGRLAHETAELVQPSLPVGVRLELDAPIDRFLGRGDSDQLAQTLVNLLGNARDALSEYLGEGRVLLRVGDPPPDLQLPASVAGKPLICIEVSDDGPGFPPDILKHLFEPFFTTKSPGKGTGLGLWNCLGTVQAHGGELLADNAPQGGARLRLLIPRLEAESSLPVPTPPSPSPSAPPPSPAGSRHPRILLVDDEETIREHGALALRDAGFDVVLAGSGEKALDRFEMEPTSYDLVVLDLSLPGISGREVCAQILKGYPSQRILVVTGYELGTGTSEPEVPGAMGHVLKPFRMATLVTEVRRLCALPT